jgi:hypothetical protein
LNGLPHAAPKATEASAPEATEAATAAPRRVAGTPTHGYEPTREGAMAAFRQELAAGVAWLRKNSGIAFHRAIHPGKAAY